MNRPSNMKHREYKAYISLMYSILSCIFFLVSIVAFLRPDTYWLPDSIRITVAVASFLVSGVFGVVRIILFMRAKKDSGVSRVLTAGFVCSSIGLYGCAAIVIVLQPI